MCNYIFNFRIKIPKLGIHNYFISVWSENLATIYYEHEKL